MKTARAKGTEYEIWVSQIINELSIKIGEKYLPKNIKLNIKFENREIDILCRNETSRLYVECKNEEYKIGAPKIRDFAEKVHQLYQEEKIKNPDIKFYAFYVSNSEFTRGILNFFKKENPFFISTGTHIGFFNIQKITYQNQCAIGYEILKSSKIIYPLLLTKDTLTRGNLEELFEIQQSNDISFEERIATCLKIWANRGKVKDTWALPTLERLSNAFFHLNRNNDALIVAQELKSITGKADVFYGTESNLLDGLSTLKLKGKLTTKKEKEYYRLTQIDGVQKIGFLQLLGDSFAKSGDKKNAIAFYAKALEEARYKHPYWEFTAARKMFDISIKGDRETYYRQAEDMLKLLLAEGAGYGQVHKDVAKEHLDRMKKIL